MSLRPSMPGVVAAVNGAGFVGYLFWIAGRGRRIFFDPQGIIYLLPCVAFIFVFACLASRKVQASSADDEHPTPNTQPQTSNSGQEAPDPDARDRSARPGHPSRT
ncbi:MAG: hypothetical protein FJ221_01955 [Lentisphaerae bacterium]|nr:hypothetical protein [Lentisphaerota bacterium]